MFTVQILIPILDNAGVAFSDEEFGAFEALVVSLFGGLTRLPGVAAGIWVAAGVTYTDETRVYLVAVKSLCDGGNIAQVVTFAKVHFRQEAICIAYLGIVEIL